MVDSENFRQKCISRHAGVYREYIGPYMVTLSFSLDWHTHHRDMSVLITANTSWRAAVGDVRAFIVQPPTRAHG